jgi:hypothetical protein
MTADEVTVEQVRARYRRERPTGGAYIPRHWDFDRDEVGALLAEIDRLRALLDAGAEQVHGMGRELRALRRQLEDARRDAGAFLRELEQL